MPTHTTVSEQTELTSNYNNNNHDNETNENQPGLFEKLSKKIYTCWNNCSTSGLLTLANFAFFSLYNLIILQFTNFFSVENSWQLALYWIAHATVISVVFIVQIVILFLDPDNKKSGNKTLREYWQDLRT